VILQPFTIANPFHSGPLTFKAITGVYLGLQLQLLRKCNHYSLPIAITSTLVCNKNISTGIV